MEGSAVTVLTIAALPLVRGQPLNCRVVARLRSVAEIFVFAVHRFEEVLRDDRAYCVQCVVTRQTLLHEARHCAHNGLQPLSDLVLHDRMKGGMRLDVRERLARGTVMLLYEFDSKLLVEREPFCWSGLDFRVVVRHGASL